MSKPDSPLDRLIPLSAGPPIAKLRLTEDEATALLLLAENSADEKAVREYAEVVA